MPSSRDSATEPPKAGWSGVLEPSQTDSDPSQPKQRDWLSIWVGIATIAAIGLAGLPGLAALLALRSTNQQVSHQLQIADYQAQIAEQGHITDRYNAPMTNAHSTATMVGWSRGESCIRRTRA
jgi:hypothetical protein